MVKEKKPDPKKQLGEEDLMHDDHGPVIIGRRDQKPKIPEGSIYTRNGALNLGQALSAPSLEE